MAREAQIPLALWISAALMFHLFGGGGTLEVAQTALDKQDLRNLVKLERQTLHPPDTEMEILAPDVEPTPSEQLVQPPDKDSEPTDDEVKPDPEKDKEIQPPKPVEPPKPKAEEPKPEVAPPTPPPPEKKKDPPLVPVVPAPAAPPPPPPPPDKRISVMQHSEKNQPDNPNAPRLAEDANHVAEETMAKIRSHDQDMENPSAGAPKTAGPANEKGNSDKDKEADSEDHIGADDHAPGESSKVATDSQHATPESRAPMQITHMAPSPRVISRVAGGKTSPGPLKAPESPPPSPGGQGPMSPEVQNGGDTQAPGWAMDPANPGGDGKSRIAGRKRAGKSFESPVHVGAVGFGSQGLPGGPNINLTMPGMTAAVGEEQLRKERENDGAARRGEHIGRMAKGTDFQKYRAAIENYDPSVKPGDKTSLNSARSAFASYLVIMHNKIHPLFGDRELGAMDSSKEQQFNDQKMFSVAEIVLSPADGRVVRRGIVKNSGSTAFDTIVLKMIDSSQPYGKAPDAIVSYDGKVYLHWEFHRDHVDACSNRNAFPIMKKQPAGTTKVTPTPTPPGAPPKTKNPDEAPAGPMRPIRE